MSDDDHGGGGRETTPPTGYTPLTAVDAEKRAMCRLQAALVLRREHEAHAAAWADRTERNHFGDSIRAAMRLGRDKDAGDTDGG